MITLPAPLRRIADKLGQSAPAVLATLARLLFAAVLLRYYWASGLTKIGDGSLGLLRPGVGAYAQIWPRAMEAAGYDASQLSSFQNLVVLAGTWAEFLLPAMVVLGLLTRLSALGMIGFIVLQSLTDIYGLGAAPEDIGRWFDRASGALILDQRALWVFLLTVLVLRGGGPLSCDRLLFRNAP
ncbi:DoxX family protein [Roseisalinus antarcticus]|uniref:DoxX n=1 Tax=Roseisalinus antarcticus TaxID=254357 RepID=A0A1Y5SUH8_9RHOB|nr:DoxX family membrane protein [Roseisalinus antarcticus]SLN48140.1 DoxX [Roseisalinus antarcticus]